MLSKQNKTEKKKKKAFESTRDIRSNAETADIYSSLPALQHGAPCPVVWWWDSPVTPLCQEGQRKGAFLASYVILNRMFK